MLVIAVVIIQGGILAFSQTQILSVFHYLQTRTSAAFAMTSVLGLLALTILILVGLFYWRHILMANWCKFCHVLIKMSKLKFVIAIVSLIVIGRVLVLILDYYPVSDGLWFHLAAQSLSENNIFGPHGLPSAYRFPGYPFLVSLTYRLFGPNLFLTWCLGLAASLLIAFTVHGIATRLYNHDVARLATFIVSLHPALALYSGTAMSDVVFTAATLLVIYFALSAFSSIWQTALLGILLGGAVFIKSTALILVIVVVAIRKFQLNSWKAVFLHTIILLLTLLMSILPWSLRNLHTLNTPALSTNLGKNLLIGNHSQATGGWTPIAHFVNEQETVIDSEQKLDRYTRNEAISYILQNPLDFIAMIPRKIARFYTTDNSAVTLYYQGAQQNTLYSKYALYALCHIAHTILLVLFLLRLMDIMKIDKRPYRLQWIPWINIFLHTLIIIIFFGSDRFRLPIMPWIVIEVCAYLVFITFSLNKVRQ